MVDIEISSHNRNVVGHKLFPKKQKKKKNAVIGLKARDRVFWTGP